jgi:hypothetical protein
MRFTRFPCLAAAFAAAIALAGCGSSPEKIPNVNAAQAGQASEVALTETDVLGFDGAQRVSEEEIAKAATPRGKIQIKRGAAVMLIQAGVSVPEEAMQREAANHFSVTPFSGLTQQKNGGADSANVSRALRLTAAKGGNDFLIVYWPAIEGAQQTNGTLEWRAVKGDIPFEAEQVRARLRVLIVDVKTGQWAVATPETLEDKSARGGWFRKRTSAQRVANLKERAYKHALQEVLRVVL